jgi:hypothetical protein
LPALSITKKIAYVQVLMNLVGSHLIRITKAVYLNQYWKKCCSFNFYYFAFEEWRHLEFEEKCCSFNFYYFEFGNIGR